MYSKEEKLKIVFVHNYYKIAGGEDIVYQNEIDLLRFYGHEVITYEENNQSIDNFLSKLLTGLFTVWNPITFIKFINIIKTFTPDIIHVHNFFPKISPSIYYAAYLLKIPIIQTIHNFRLICPKATLYRNNHICELCIDKTFPYTSIKYNCYHDSKIQTFSISLMLMINKIFGTWGKRASKIIFLTNFQKSKFLNLNIPETKTVIKHNFIKMDPGESFTKDNFFLFIGRLSEEKGIIELINLWDKLNIKTKLLIIGDGPLKDHVVKLIKTSSNINYLGHQNHENTLEILKSAYGLILFSKWYEGFPMVLIEAFATGTPVIAPNIGSIGEIIKDFHNGRLFELENTNDFQYIVHWALENTNKWKKIGQNNRIDYLNLYNDKIAYDRLMKIYISVLEEKRI